jgi:hypothetical protein
MTDSRETVRRKQYQAHATIRPAAPELTPLTDLCIIVGCLNLRTGANLCDEHNREEPR